MQCSNSYLCTTSWHSSNFGISLGYSMSLANLGPGLALFSFAWCDVSRAVTLKMISTALEATVSWTR